MAVPTDQGQEGTIYVIDLSCLVLQLGSLLHDYSIYDTYHFNDFVFPNLKIIIKPTTPDTDHEFC